MVTQMVNYCIKFKSYFIILFCCFTLSGCAITSVPLTYHKGIVTDIKAEELCMYNIIIFKEGNQVDAFYFTEKHKSPMIGDEIWFTSHSDPIVSKPFLDSNSSNPCNKGFNQLWVLSGEDEFIVINSNGVPKTRSGN
jgi:hypothetical protein